MEWCRRRPLHRYAHLDQQVSHYMILDADGFAVPPVKIVLAVLPPSRDTTHIDAGGCRQVAAWRMPLTKITI
jgi:hypothetical protein